MTQFKTVYAVGVGPGDSQLLTLKAVSVLKKVKTIFIPQASEKKESLARQIIAPFIQEQKISHLFFPMTRESQILEQEWSKAAKQVLATLKSEDEVAFVTLGDPSLYSTFIYLHLALLKQAKQEEMQVNFKIIPGVSSIQVAAAKLGLPLAKGGENIAIMSGANLSNLEELLKQCQTVVVMKAASHLKQIIKVVNKLNCEAYLVKRLGLNDEEVFNLTTEQLPKGNHYLSLVVIKNNG